MYTRTFSLLLAGALLLASCGQQSATTSDGAHRQSVPVVLTADQRETVNVLQQSITDIRAAQAQSAATGQMPVDDQGQAIDLNALAADYQATADEYVRMQTTDSMIAQSDGTFVAIYRDDNFRNNHLNYVHYMTNYDWSTDGCSGPAKYTGYADNFYWPCVQHDFGYRNNRRAGFHNEWTRYDIDVYFLRHMDQLCSHYAILAKAPCYYMAKKFYQGVRYGGWSAFY